MVAFFALSCSQLGLVAELRRRLAVEMSDMMVAQWIAQNSAGCFGGGDVTIKRNA